MWTDAEVLEILNAGVRAGVLVDLPAAANLSDEQWLACLDAYIAEQLAELYRAAGL